jgi:phage terminase large subunit-like protein
VKQRYIEPAAGDIAWGRPEPGAVWRPTATEDRPRPLTRCFIPARLEDNQALLKRDPQYVDRLLMITKRGLRRALRHGDWDAIDMVEGALWDPVWIDTGRVPEAPLSLRRVVAVDPSDGDEGGDEYGVNVSSRGMDGHGYCEFSDGWTMSPKELAKSTVELYHDLRCDKIVVEKNHGGKWVPALMKQVERSIPIDTVWASEGKRTRAEPVASLFEPDSDDPTSRFHIVGRQDGLEGELTSFTGKPGETSPNMLDALVWAAYGLGLAQSTGGQGRFGGGQMAAATIGGG